MRISERIKRDPSVAESTLPQGDISLSRTEISSLWDNLNMTTITKTIFGILMLALLAACAVSVGGETLPPQPTATSAPTFTPVLPIVTVTPRQPVATSVPSTTPTADSPGIEPKQPPACTFPLAQTTTVESQPENYTFSEPKVVLTNGDADAAISVVEWLPDNQRVLIMREFRANMQQNIELFNPQTGEDAPRC